MNDNIQTLLLNIVKQKVEGDDSFGRILSELLNISMDAAYRRNRNETPLTIDEVNKICSHFNISFDALAKIEENRVTFDYSPLSQYDFNLNSYLEGMASGLRNLSKGTDPFIMLSSNNIAIFQLLNFPRLSHFRLYFWAKTYLQIEAFKDKLFEEQRIADSTFEQGVEILDHYVNIRTVECYDSEFLKGFMRQIQYYASARLFKDPNYPLRLMDEVKLMVDHIREQTIIGRKFKYKDQIANYGKEYDVYLNDTINADTNFYYSAKEQEGVYLSHNHMNYLHTTDPTYVSETKSILDKQIANSSIISKVNEKARNAFFHKLHKNIALVRSQIEADLES